MHVETTDCLTLEWNDVVHDHAPGTGLNINRGDGLKIGPSGSSTNFAQSAFFMVG